MISAPTTSSAYLASAWVSGIACLFLGIGLSGAVAPLVPDVPIEMTQIDTGNDVMLEEFSAPSAPAAAIEEPQTQDLVEDVEIPPLPEIMPPLTPPEMVEITPLELIAERPAAPAPRPETKPRQTAGRKSPTPSRSQGTSGASSSGAGRGGRGGEPVLFTGQGGGHFPAPYYPASARMEGKQGTVLLRVTVEASGVASSASVSTSSGSSILDAAARDHVQRRWRWPVGAVRDYTVHIRFRLQ